jgi:selenocysteine-specific elongation factor
VRLGIPPVRVEALLEGSRGLQRIGARIVSGETLDHAAESVVKEVDKYLSARHFERGAPRAILTASTSFPAELVDEAVTALVKSGRLQVTDGLIALAGWVPAVNGADAKLRSEIYSLLDSAAMEPPTVSELKERLKLDPLPVLRHLEREGEVVLVEASRYYAKSALDRAVARMRQEMQPGREYSPAELREVLGSTRKYLIPFLEYCDRHRITERHPGGRVLRAG